MRRTRSERKFPPLRSVPMRLPDPSAVAALVADGRGWVVRHEGSDGTYLECFSVEDEVDGVRMYRRMWWVDEESGAWEADACEVWELDRAGVNALRNALQPRRG